MLLHSTAGALMLALCVTIAAPAFAGVDPSQTAQAAGAYPDVPASSWVFDAVQQLAQEGYIKGYPGGQYKGGRPMTRYEVAALVSRADTAIRDAIAAGAEVKPADIDALRKLLAAFGNEVKDIQARVAALEATTGKLGGTVGGLQQNAAALKAEEDATQLAIVRAHFNDTMLFRPGTETINFQVLNGPATFGAGATATAPYSYIHNLALAPGTRGPGFSWGAGTLNSTVVGTTGNGVEYFLEKVNFSGQIDHGWSYGARLTTGEVHQDAGNGLTTGTGFCTGLVVTNCSYDDLSNTQGSIPIILEYADTAWTSPGGIYAVVGKFPVSEGNYVITPNSLNFSGQNISGATAGYRSPDGNLQAAFIYGYAGVSATTLASVNANVAPGAAAANTLCAANVVGLNHAVATNISYTGFNPNCNETSSEFGSTLSYHFKTNTVVELSEDYDKQKLNPLWDPAAVSCLIGATTLAATSPASCTNSGGRVTTVPGGAGNYFSGQTDLGNWSAVVIQYFGNKNRPQFALAGTYTSRIGNDPFTGAYWTGAHAAVGSLTFASKGNLTLIPPGPFIPNPGLAGSTVFQLAVTQFGQNSDFGVNSGPVGGTPTPTNNLGLSNYNGMRFYQIQLARWFTNNVRVGILAIHAQNIPGVGLSIGGNGLGGVNTCPGCTGSININQLDLESYLQM